MEDVDCQQSGADNLQSCTRHAPVESGNMLECIIEAAHEFVVYCVSALGL
jgi:hypothetical protein